MITTGHADNEKAVTPAMRRQPVRKLDLNRVIPQLVSRLRRWLDPEPQAATALNFPTDPIWIRTLTDDIKEVNMRVAEKILSGREGRPQASHRTSKAASLSAGRGRAILVVDDEPSIRKMLVEVLKLQGYRIESVADGELALRILEDDPEIRLVLTDMVMDGMGGPEIIEHLLANRPDLKLVCMSGTEQDERVRGMLERNRIPFIPKPFRPSEVLRKVRQALEEDEA